MNFMRALTRLVVGMSRLGDHLLKQKVGGIVLAALAFACGAGLASALKGAPHAAVAVVATQLPARAEVSMRDTAADYPPVGDDRKDSHELQEWKNRHSGAPLALDYDSPSNSPELSDSKVVVLPSGQILTLAGGDLHMLGADQRVVWKYDTPHAVNNFLHLKATGVIYVTDDGNNMFILDAATGRVLRGEPRGGRAWYGALVPYGEGTCLIVDRLGSYRMGYEGGPGPTQDGVTAWVGTRMLWRRDVPPDAELQVVGSRVYAVTRTQTRILVKEIPAPR